MLIAQLSDVHVGGSRYRKGLLRTAIEEINAAGPDLVVVAGDLTDDGYPDQYPVARDELDALACPQVVRVPGNHDARNVGYLGFRRHVRGAELARAGRGRRTADPLGRVGGELEAAPPVEQGARQSRSG
jgi:3',5'-cyclic AMP phosphodiesterase CpdA